MNEIVVDSTWQHLRQFTSARIALGRTGCSLPTRELLDFELMRGRARDAVYSPFAMDEITTNLTAEGLSSVRVHSAARDRAEYLRRPDLGSVLNMESGDRVKEIHLSTRPDVVFVIADGLSANAPGRHALLVLRTVLDELSELHFGPVIIAEQARVALGDQIGELMCAGMIIMFIGERPGLSSPASLGIYITYNPRISCTNDQRNCISNVRHGGMSNELAAQKLCELIVAARHFGVTGIDLKDSSRSAIPLAATGLIVGA